MSFLIIRDEILVGQTLMISEASGKRREEGKVPRRSVKSPPWFRYFI
jgi:hypothetical protein